MRKLEIIGAAAVTVLVTLAPAANAGSKPKVVSQTEVFTCDRGKHQARFTHQGYAVKSGWVSTKWLVNSGCKDYWMLIWTNTAPGEKAGWVQVQPNTSFTWGSSALHDFRMSFHVTNGMGVELFSNSQCNNGYQDPNWIVSPSGVYSAPAC